MNNKPGNTYRKRSFAQTQKGQKVSESKQKYFQLLPLALVVLEFFVTFVLLLCYMKIPEARAFFVFLWILATGVLLAGLWYGRWVKNKLFGSLLAKKELEEIYRTMNPLDFEHYVAERFRKVGYTDVKVTPAMGDGGIDILMKKEGTSYAVQCKKYFPDSFVKIDELRAFVYAYRKAGAEKGIYVTTANFGVIARKEMEGEGVSLIDGSELLREWE